jgi:uncharacterized protein (DUF1778 family)
MQFGILDLQTEKSMATRSILTERRTVKLDIRVSPAEKAKLQAAASAVHRSMSDFVMESALARAEDTLAGRRVFGLNAEKWAAFQAAFDAPVRPLPRLKALLDEPGFFDVGAALL